MIAYHYVHSSLWKLDNKVVIRGQSVTSYSCVIPLHITPFFDGVQIRWGSLVGSLITGGKYEPSYIVHKYIVSILNMFYNITVYNLRGSILHLTGVHHSNLYLLLHSSLFISFLIFLCSSIYHFWYFIYYHFVPFWFFDFVIRFSAHL